MYHKLHIRLRLVQEVSVDTNFSGSDYHDLCKLFIGKYVFFFIDC